VLELQAGSAAKSTATLEKLLQFTCFAHKILCFFIVLENNTRFYLCCRLNTACERKNVDKSAVSTFLLRLLHVHRITGIVGKSDGEFCNVYGRNGREMDWVKETNRTGNILRKLCRNVAFSQTIIQWIAWALSAREKQTGRKT
jgi:hypothetical protein